MTFNLDHVVLAQLDVPDVATANAQLKELLQPGGQRVEPAAEYEARDPSGTIRVVVDARRSLTDVDIQLSWASRIPAARLAAVLFQTPKASASTTRPTLLCCMHRNRAIRG
ncbi:hypothetical protein [Amycolatopsis sp. NBC_01480]|uniref:hypothetical protein n=1 Tax=Amycolatopsis sp. NBC_01480 TaxID=2903562 RepID=UPI002E2CB619|nr:hypothetical protein [Amycolatopsis sp. NBC_01480]